MIKASIETSSNEKTFIRQALSENGIRLDGRGIDDYREIIIELERGEATSMSKVNLGCTTVISVVTGEIVTPYPDRPVEGMLQFSAHISTHTEIAGLTQWELTRMLERSIKDSEAMDTESLCIVGGERVWQINVAVTVVDGTGGNIIDACMLSVISALKAFRKPDVSVVPVALMEDETATKTNKGFNLDTVTGTAKANVSVMVHHSNNREPLPLALHHTPITVTLGIMKGQVAGDSAEGAEATKISKTILLTDPSKEEEHALDGRIVFSVNAHNELCAVSKPAGRGLTTSIIVQAAQIASSRAMMLHERLNTAILSLEETVKTERERQLTIMQKYNMHMQQQNGSSNQLSNPSNASTAKEEKKTKSDKSALGIDRNDPILQWSTLHKAAGLSE